MTDPAVLTQLADLAGVNLGSDPTLLDAEIHEIIMRSAASDPRTLQTKIGPSGLGTPCDRRLGYQLLEMRGDESDKDPWKAMVGKAVHSHLESVFAAENRRAGVVRWLTEERVSVGDVLGEDISGNTDMLDLVTRTVIDWKISGVKNIAKYRMEGPGDQYKAQANLYGRGWLRKGIAIERVAIMFLPRDGGINQRHLWSESFDLGIAERALTRASAVKLATSTLGLSALPLLSTAPAYCGFCPYMKRGSNGRDWCPGHEASVAIAERRRAGAS
jgi:hypothetical protein